MSTIDPSVLQQADEIGARFAASQPFRHVVIADFLDRGLCERLLADFPSFEDRHALNEIGEVARCSAGVVDRPVAVAPLPQKWMQK